VEAGVDIIDTAIEPLSWGKVHPDIISVLSMLRHAGFDVPDINMDAYMKALPADNTPDPYADIPVFSTPTSDVLAKQGI